MLVLAGVELIFFIVASVGLCFGFVLETVLITQEQCLHHAEAFSASLARPWQRAGWGAWEGGHAAGTAEPTDPRDSPHHS